VLLVLPLPRRCFLPVDAMLWGAGGLITVISALVALIYNRVNVDIKGVGVDVEDAFVKCDQLAGSMQTRCELIGNELATIKMQLAQFAQVNVSVSQELDKIEVDIKNLSDRFIKLSAEHSLCFSEYQDDHKKESHR